MLQSRYLSAWSAEMESSLPTKLLPEDTVSSFKYQ